MGVREVSAEDVEMEYVSAAGIRERGSLGRLWSVRFESVRPERRYPAFRGQGNALTSRLGEDQTHLPGAQCDATGQVTRYIRGLQLPTRR